MTFFSLLLNYGSSESMKRPAFPETVSDTDGECCCILRILITDYSPFVSLSRLGDLFSLCPKSFQQQQPCVFVKIMGQANGAVIQCYKWAEAN